MFRLDSHSQRSSIKAIGKESILAIRSPDHLGDGVMALPAIKALSSIYELHIIGPRWVTELYPTFTRFFYSPNPKPLCSSIALFKPSFGSAWRARNYQRKIGIDNGLRRHLLTVRCHGGNHRIDQFNSIAQALHAQPNLLPQFSPNTADIPTLPTDFNLCIVGTNSAETVQWKQFPELARQLSQQSIFLVVLVMSTHSKP